MQPIAYLSPCQLIATSFHLQNAAAKRQISLATAYVASPASSQFHSIEQAKMDIHNHCGSTANAMALVPPTNKFLRLDKLSGASTFPACLPNHIAGIDAISHLQLGALRGDEQAPGEAKEYIFKEKEQSTATFEKEAGKEAAQEANRQAAIVAEEQEIAALVAWRATRGKLLMRDQWRLDILLRNAARREEQQTTCDTKEQAVLKSNAAVLEDDCLALATTFSVVPEVAVNGNDSTTPTSIVQPIEHHPKAGTSFMIRTRAEPHYILTVENGELRLLSKPTLGGGFFWHCVKKSGWLTFRNSVTGTYLNHDGQGKLSAKKAYQEMHEYFVTERHESGGYILAMMHSDELFQVAVSKCGKWLIEQREGGTTWDFIEAKYVCSSVTLTYSI